MNILITSVGRRSYLVRYFQQALGGKGFVVATNTHSNAPGMQAADYSLIVPPSYNVEYKQMILDICKKYDIGILCSFHDLDTFVLSTMRDELKNIGVTPVLPDAEWGRICLDKFECGERLREAGFAVPWSSVSLENTKDDLEAGRINFPLIVKSRYGFGSLGLNLCHNFDELQAIILHELTTQGGSLIDKFLHVHSGTSMLIQECIHGQELCTIILNDLSGNYRANYITEIHSMRAGESDVASTLSPNKLDDFPQRFGRLTKHIGPWGVDVIVREGQPIIIDVNPRFTGDYPFQHIAGANIPAALIAWAEGFEPDADWLRSEIDVKGFKDLLPTRLISKK